MPRRLISWFAVLITGWGVTAGKETEGPLREFAEAGIHVVLVTELRLSAFAGVSLNKNVLAFTAHYSRVHTP